MREIAKPFYVCLLFVGRILIPTSILHAAIGRSPFFVIWGNLVVGGENWPLVPPQLDADPLADQKGYGLTFRTDDRVGIDEGASRRVHGAQRVTECAD